MAFGHRTQRWLEKKEREKAQRDEERDRETCTAILSSTGKRCTHKTTYGLGWRLRLCRAHYRLVEKVSLKTPVTVSFRGNEVKSCVGGVVVTE